MQGKEEEERFREWLDLDQADEDIGLIIPTTTNNTNNNNNTTHLVELHCLPPFSTHDHFQRNPLRLHQLHPLHQHQQALDPSTIFHYPSIEPAIEPSIETCIGPSIETATNRSIEPCPSVDHRSNHAIPNYALDPALISASIPSSHHPPMGTTRVHPPHATTPPPPKTSSVYHSTSGSKVSLPRRSVPSQLQLKRDFDIEQDDDEEEDHQDDDQRAYVEEREGAVFEHKTNKNNHSRSSSAILFPPANTSSQMHKRSLSYSHPLIDMPDWEDKPSAEEYKMLSSKEKRQLRNKISARNFRHRRKQHISTLEQQLAQRDQAIESLNNNLGQITQENKELKSQVQVLKQKWSDLMKKIEEMSLNPTAHPTPTTAASSQTIISTGSQSGLNLLNPASPRSRSAKTNGMIPLPNLHKDLGSHTRKPFNGVGGMTGGGNVGVHTTLIPEVAVNIYAEPPLTRPTSLLQSNWVSPGHDLSPQALIEAKMRHEKTITSRQMTNKTSSKGLELNLDVGSPVLDGSYTHHQPRALSCSPTTHVSLGKLDPETPQETQKEVSERLTRMVLEALQVERPDSYDHPTVDAIDPNKLKACLDGRVVFKLVEHSPPPYWLVPGKNDARGGGVNSSLADPSDRPHPASHIQTFENLVRLSTRLSNFRI